jgi:hypothetical protein
MEKLTTRDRALELAASIIEDRAAEIKRVHDRWCEQYPTDAIGAATERSAYLECVLLARLVRSRLSPAGRAALEASNE